MIKSLFALKPTEVCAAADTILGGAHALAFRDDLHVNLS